MKVFTLITLILASFIGAGTCSGREVCSYFIKYGNGVYLLCAIFGLILFFVMRIFLLVGDNVKTHTGVLCTFATFIISSSMIAGSYSLGDTTCTSLAIFFCTIIIAIMLCCGGISKLGLFSVFIVPIMLILIIGVSYLNCGEINFALPQPKSAFTVINYLCFNMLTMGLFLMSIGSKYSKKQITLASIFSSLIISIMMMIMCNAMLSHPMSQLVDMPMIYLSKAISDSAMKVYKWIVWFALLTTLTTSVYSLSNLFEKYIKNKVVAILVVVAICACISVLGFVNIVNYLYSALGVIGFVFVCDVIASYYIKKYNKKFTKK